MEMGRRIDVEASALTRSVSFSRGSEEARSYRDVSAVFLTGNGDVGGESSLGSIGTGTRLIVRLTVRPRCIDTIGDSGAR